MIFIVTLSTIGNDSEGEKAHIALNKDTFYIF